jgi:hypothetical protein
MIKTELLAASARGEIFSAEEVRAILEGRKTRTTRVIKKLSHCPVHGIDPIFSHGYLRCNGCDHFGVKPRHKPGDIIYVREAWKWHQLPGVGKGAYIFKADARPENALAWIEGWKPSTHMPRKAARIFLRVTDVKVQRVQDASEEEAIAEGVTRLFDYLSDYEFEEWRKRIHRVNPDITPVKEKHEQPFTNYLWHGHIGRGITQAQSDAWRYQMSAYKSARESFSSLWEKVNARRGYGWDANPLCWVYEFERLVTDDHS